MILHPGTSIAILNAIGPIFYGVLGLAICSLVASWIHHFRVWLKARKDDHAPSEFQHNWPQETRK